MDHDATSEVAGTCLTKDAAVRQHAATPDPVNHRCVTKQHPQARKEQNKAKANTLNICADNQCGCDDCKGHLEGKKQNLGDCTCQSVCVDAGKEHLVQTAPIAARAAAKSDGISEG